MNSSAPYIDFHKSKESTFITIGNSLPFEFGDFRYASVGDDYFAVGFCPNEMGWFTKFSFIELSTLKRTDVELIKTDVLRGAQLTSSRLYDGRLLPLVVGHDYSNFIFDDRKGKFIQIATYR